MKRCSAIFFYNLHFSIFLSHRWTHVQQRFRQFEKMEAEGVYRVRAGESSGTAGCGGYEVARETIAK